jgi:hypothetical protein
VAAAFPLSLLSEQLPSEAVSSLRACWDAAAEEGRVAFRERIENLDPAGWAELVAAETAALEG